MLELRIWSGVLNWANTTIVSWNIELTRRASEMHPTVFFARLKHHFLTMLVTLGADVMRRLAIAHTFLQRVDSCCLKHSDQLVSISLASPVFKLHELLFKLLFVAQQRRILYLYGRDTGLKLNNDTLKLYELGVALCLVGSAGNVSSGLGETGNCSKECGEGIGHSSSNVKIRG